MSADFAQIYEDNICCTTGRMTMKVLSYTKLD